MLRAELTHLDVERNPGAAARGAQLGGRVAGLDLFQDLGQPARRELLQDTTPTPEGRKRKVLS